MSKISETQREAQEIITHATYDLRHGEMEFWQWWEVTRRAMLDAFGAMLGYADDE